MGRRSLTARRPGANTWAGAAELGWAITLVTPSPSSTGLSCVSSSVPRGGSWGRLAKPRANRVGEQGRPQLWPATRTCPHTAGPWPSVQTDLLAAAPHLNTLHTHPQRNSVHTCSCCWNNREKKNHRCLPAVFPDTRKHLYRGFSVSVPGLLFTQGNCWRAD